MDFLEDRVKYMDMDLDEKRAGYLCKNSYITLDDIPTWTEYSRNITKIRPSSEYKINKRLNDNVSVFVGDIITLEIDAIVISANISAFLERAYFRVEDSIPRSFAAECAALNGCARGEAKITGGYKLPARYVIHTVGPSGEQPDILINCYLNSLNIAKRKGWKTVAFPCIGTGVYQYPREKAAHIALKVVREFLEENPHSVDRIIFSIYQQEDVAIYESLMQNYFPL